MKILYVIQESFSRNSGIIEKVKQNALQWSLDGHSVFFLSIYDSKVYGSSYDVFLSCKECCEAEANYSRLRTFFRIYKTSSSMEGLVSSINPDLIYTRFLFFTPFAYFSFSKRKVVMEINGDDLVETRMRSFLTYLYNRLTRKLFLSSVDGFVFVSRELKDRFGFFNKPSVVIANGIDCGKYSVNVVSNNRPNLVFIASPGQSWQGLDKILDLADRNRDFTFHIIGTSDKNTENVSFHGYLSQENANEIIKNCDVGIGSLALYRQGLNEASPLKTRSYLAFGLPIVSSYIDTDINCDQDFVLQFENTEFNIDNDRFRAFVMKVFGDNALREKAREFATGSLDYSIKEQSRLAFFERIIG